MLDGDQNPNPGGMKPNPDSELEQLREAFHDATKAIAAVIGTCSAAMGRAEKIDRARRAESREVRLFAAFVLSQLAKNSTVAAAMLESIGELELEPPAHPEDPRS